jgi:hypothetical protein
MTGGLEPILTLTFGAGGSENNYLGDGWSGDEPGGRWMIGQSSEIWLEHPGPAGDPVSAPGRDLILELDVNVIETPGGMAQRLLVGIRNAGIAQIAVSRGGTIGFHVPAALVAAPGPVRVRFIHPDMRRPADFNGGSDQRDLSFSVRSLRLFRVPPRPTPVTAPSLPRDQMIMRFESLGDNCEFGLVQRRLGAEPLGLLRFSFIELPLLRHALLRRFEGLGEPGTIEVIVSGSEREFVVKEAAYGMTYHTFQYEHQVSLEAVREQQTSRLRFLRRKLLEDIAAGEKIFVLKRDPPLRPEEVLPIYTILNEAGPTWLLWMVPEDATHKAGTVEILLPGLLRGFIDRFAPSENAHELSMPVWTSVCDAAWRAVGGVLRA